MRIYTPQVKLGNLEHFSFNVKCVKMLLHSNDYNKLAESYILSFLWGLHSP